MVGENSLSGGERSIRIFSLAAASSSASPFPPLSAGEPLIKKRNRGLKQQVRRLKGRRNLQVNWKAIWALFFLDICKKKGDSMKFQGILLAGVRLWRVAGRRDACTGWRFTAGTMTNSSWNYWWEQPHIGNCTSLLSPSGLAGWLVKLIRNITARFLFYFFFNVSLNPLQLKVSLYNMCKLGVDKLFTWWFHNGF